MFKTLTEACRAWVAEMDHIPMSVVEKLANLNYEDFMEVTPPTVCDRVYVLDSEFQGEGEVVETNYDGEEDLYLVKMDSDPDDPKVICRADMEVLYEDRFPMWGTMFSFSDPCDEHWIEGNLQTMADCGFRIYQSEDYGYIFGIDGAGYNFYEAHWIPLYKARGFQWHEVDDTVKEKV